MKKQLYCLMGLALALSSCSEDVYDVSGNPDNLIYYPAGQTANFTVISTPAGYVGDKVTAKFGLRCTRPMSGGAAVNAAVDNDRVAAYNAEHGTDYQVCSANVSISSAHFADGSYSSADSIAVTIPEDQYTAFGEGGKYLIPVRLTDANNGKPTVAEQSYAYIFVNVERRLVNEDANWDDAEGTLITDYSGWTVTSTDTSIKETDYANLFDENARTLISFENEQNPTVIVDMQDVKSVSAFRLIFGGSYGASVSISCSKDNVTWEEIGSSSMSGEHTVVLYGTIEARYIKLSLQWRYGEHGGYYRKFSDFSVKAK